jgi:acetolactate synthase-1/2/3 large subunit
MARNGGQILVDALKVQGASHASCVPGESYLPILDALYDARDAIRLITCRQEGGAANMAEAFGKLTGKPGLCFVTRGPGATNASIGVHTAFQDSTPMILFIGQAEQGMLDREAFQEVDFKAMFAPLAKWSAEIRETARIPEYVARAFQVATSGRPGPVVLSLPEDVLWGEAVPLAAKRTVAIEVAPSPDALARLRALLAKAERPFLLLGGPGWTASAATDIRLAAERLDLPVLTGFRGKDRFDNTHPNYCGDLGIGADPSLVERVTQSDLVIALGERLGEMTTDGYTRISAPVPKQALVHVYPDAGELNRVYQAELPILSGVAPFARAFAQLSAVEPRWASWRRDARAAFEAWAKPVAAPGEVNPSEIFAWLSKHLPADAILANGAGNYAAWLHRFYLYRGFPSLLGPQSGAMGYGVPAAIAAKLIHPERTVVACAGDGCFLMSSQELATAAQYGANVIVLVFDNAMYGTIRMHQERAFPGRVSGTDLRNPDFSALAESYGAMGLVVNRTEEFPAAFAKAQSAGRPALLHIKIDPEAISPVTTLSKLRAAKR